MNFYDFLFYRNGELLYAAGEIAAAQEDRVFSIAALMDEKKDVYQYELAENELLVLFPGLCLGTSQNGAEFLSENLISRETLRLLPMHLRQ
jgi:hypothetical protein